MAIELGDAVLKIGADATDLESGLKKAEASIKKSVTIAATAMTALGASITATTALIVNSVVNAGDEIQKMALRTGIATSSLSELKFAAELSGTSIQTLEIGVRRMSGVLDDAADGLETSVDILKKLGLTLEDFSKLNPEQRFLKFSEAISKIPDASARAAAAQDVFGRSGTALLPILDKGIEGLNAMRKEANELGLGFSQISADNAADFIDIMQKVRDVLFGIGKTIVEPLIPSMTRFIQKFVNAGKAVVQFVKENTELVQFLFKATVAFGALLTAVGAAALGSGVLSSAIAALTAGLPGLIILGTVVAGLGTAIAALALAWEENLGGIKDFVKDFVDTTKNLFQAASQAVQAFFKDSFPVDDLKSSLNTGLTILLDFTENVLNKMVDIIRSNWDNIKLIIRAAIAILQGDWRTAWDNIKQVFENIWESLAPIVGAAWLKIKAGIARIKDGILEELPNIMAKILEFFARNLPVIQEKISKLVTPIVEEISKQTKIIFDELEANLGDRTKRMLAILRLWVIGVKFELLKLIPLITILEKVGLLTNPLSDFANSQQGNSSLPSIPTNSIQAPIGAQFQQPTVQGQQQTINQGGAVNITINTNDPFAMADKLDDLKRLGFFGRRQFS